MLRFIVRRTLLAVLTLTVVSIFTFGLFFSMPADPARLQCGEKCTPEQVEQVRASMGIDDPIVTQYTNFVRGVFVGRTIGEGDMARECAAPCLGVSFATGEEVTDQVKRGLPVSASIAIGAWLMATVIGVFMGMIAARHRGRWLDKLSIGLTLAAFSMPIFLLAALMLLVLRYGLQIVPQPSYTPLTSDPLAWAGGLMLPWLSLALIQFATDARLTRSQVLETLGEDFIRTSKAKGLRDRVVYWRHALRASITPVATNAGLGLGFLLGGALVTESIFGLNGLGRMALQAIRDYNLPVVMAMVLLSSVFIVIATAVVDMLYAVIDPRVRMN